MKFPVIGASYKNVNSNFKSCGFKQDEATSEDGYSQNRSRNCLSQQQSDEWPFHANGCTVLCHFSHFLSSDAKHIQLLEAEPPSILLNPT